MTQVATNTTNRTMHCSATILLNKKKAFSEKNLTAAHKHDFSLINFLYEGSWKAFVIIYCLEMSCPCGSQRIKTMQQKIYFPIKIFSLTGTPARPGMPGGPSSPGSPLNPSKPGTPLSPGKPGRPSSPGDPFSPLKPGKQASHGPPSLPARRITQMR